VSQSGIGRHRAGGHPAQFIDAAGAAGLLFTPAAMVISHRRDQLLEPLYAGARISANFKLFQEDEGSRGVRAASD
jgi:hypothetical protein